MFGIVHNYWVITNYPERGQNKLMYILFRPYEQRYLIALYPLVNVGNSIISRVAHLHFRRTTGSNTDMIKYIFSGKNLTQSPLIGLELITISEKE